MNEFLYISYGAGAKMYTLRQFSKEIAWTRGEGGVPVAYERDSDYHCVNLSITLEDAKAALVDWMENFSARNAV